MGIYNVSIQEIRDRHSVYPVISVQSIWCSEILGFGKVRTKILRNKIGTKLTLVDRLFRFGLFGPSN
jgi:hypothetical protein